MSNITSWSQNTVHWTHMTKQGLKVDSFIYCVILTTHSFMCFCIQTHSLCLWEGDEIRVRELSQIIRGHYSGNLLRSWRWAAVRWHGKPPAPVYLFVMRRSFTVCDFPHWPSCVRAHRAGFSLIIIVIWWQYMWPWSTTAVLNRWGIFVAIAKNTSYGSKLLIFLLCQKSLGY